MKILLFEPYCPLLDAVEKFLIRAGHEVLSCFGGEVFPDKDDDSAWGEIDVIIMEPVCGYMALPDGWDVKEGWLTGVALIEHFCPRRDIPVVLRTTLGDEEIAEAMERLMGLGHTVVVSRKPSDMKPLMAQIARL